MECREGCEKAPVRLAMAGGEPGDDLPETFLRESSSYGQTFLSSIVHPLKLGGWEVAYRFEQPPSVEPVHPFKGRALHSLKRPPCGVASNDFGPEQTDHRFGDRIVVGIAD